ncbi:transmembrane protein 216-like isoform X1 [Erpetoichthys calabaricus]|uniref:transmembrane protein 216-like isoform X1 n=2 Tax=Erpetoichthys calabaricus TaxID=27687 RepID=UPI00223440F6|nr:transmembrane protein 216-like isoform X1 [Erpetoichthys calabaricus]
MAARGKGIPILSSAPLEFLFFLNTWYFTCYFIAEILMFIYKGLVLPYSPANLTLDLVMLFLYLGVEILRLFFGSKGNLTQRSLPLAVCLTLTLPCAMMAVYYLLLQTYVLRVEVILNAILLVFCLFEIVLEIATLAAFSRAKMY